VRAELQQLSLPLLASGKKLFFAADFHLAYTPSEPMRKRENRVIAWLEMIQPTAQALFLLGDIFDFWFEYTHFIPKGFIRFQRQLLHFVEKGIPVYLVPGNHDGWVKDYFEKEIGLMLLADRTTVCIGEKKICIGHGDTWGASLGYRLIKKYIYNFPLCQWLARQLPPDALARLAFYLSNKRRISSSSNYQSPKEDRILTYCKTSIEPFYHHDYYIAGHAHVPAVKPVGNNSIYLNVGDWIHYSHYVTFDTTGCQLLPFKD
jgi:UDP-2,3-diacylglucosamine hydrolase